MGCGGSAFAEPEPSWTPEPPSPIPVIGQDLSGNTIATVEATTWWLVRDLKEEFMTRLALDPEDVFIEIIYEGKLLKNEREMLKRVLPKESNTSPPPVVLVTTAPLPRRIPHGVEVDEEKRRPGDGGMWSGIAESGGRLFLAPHHAESVLVVDAASGTTSTISTGVDGDGKWSGIAACAGRLYCAPYNASVVLVIDPATNRTSTIECSRTWRFQGRGGEPSEMLAKWSGAVACGGRVYCAPTGSCGLEEVLVIDASTDTCSVIVPPPHGAPMGRRVPNAIRWGGIAECGGRIYCAPARTEAHVTTAGRELLSIDPATQTARMLPCDGLPDQRDEWRGVAACGGRLICVSSRKIVAIDPATCEVSTIAELGSNDSDNWSAVVECGGRLYCPPYTGRDVLVIDPVACTTSKIPLGPKCHGGWFKWGNGAGGGAASCSDGRVYCAPEYHAEVLVITPPPAVCTAETVQVVAADAVPLTE